MRWSIIVLIAVILLAVWIVGIFFPELRWVAELVTGTVVAVVLAVLLIRWIRKRLKARALEREMLKQSGSDQSPEIAALRADMENAVRTLKRQRRGAGGGRAALYGLPWYVIVGPPAVGKTTAFERSGLSFVPSAAGAAKIRGTAGTRNCDWWFAHEAILLDTAGRFATGDSDHDEWMAFLDALHRLRPERPLDRLLVAVSLPDILSKSEAERDELAAKLRARVDEVHQRLEMVLPVYLLLTKADLVAGFVEFWADLGKTQRSQAWGTSFELDDPRLEEPGKAIESEFDVLVEGLYSRLLERVPAERDAVRRARIMQFPVELRALRSPLSQFVDALCGSGRDSQLLLLRGFYLTSAVQEGRPIERVLSEMMRGFELNVRQAQAVLEQRETHSYFLTDLFKKVILPDVGLATRSAAGIERRSRRELRAALVALGIAAFVLFPATVSYVRNTQLAQEVERTARAVRASPPASIAGTKGDPIDAMLDTLDRLEGEASGFGIPGWFSPRAARELRGPLRAAYLARIHSVLRSRVAPELERELGNISRARRLDDSIDTPEDRTPLRKAYEALKLYVTLVDPKDHVELPWAAEQLAGVWQRTLPGGTAVDPQRLSRHAANYLVALSTEPGLNWPAPPALQEARVRLKELGVDQLPYRWALRRAYDQPPILTSDVADAVSLKYLTCPAEQELVPHQYTAGAWQKIAAALDSRERLPPEAHIERWVIADMRIPTDEKVLRGQIRDQYYSDYTARWLSLLDKCSITRPADFASSQDELTALKGPKGFYKTLFFQFSANAIADEKKDLLPVPLPLSTEGCAARFASARPDAGAAAQLKTVSPVQRSFEPILVFSGDAEDAKKPAPLEKYLTILESLRATLEGVSDAPGSADPRPEFARARRGVEALLDGLQEPIKGKLNRLLLPPVEGTIKVTETGRTDSISSEWEKKVWSTWDGKLRRVFPFSGIPAVRDAAAFEDFRGFFQPDGSLWAFVKTNLGDSVEASEAGYSTKPGGAALAPDLLQCLSVAQEISEAFFPAGDEAGLRFSLQVDWSAPDVTESKFYVADKATVLPKAQWSPSLRWNGEGVKLEWVQGGRATQEIGRRSFSLFDLFEQLGGLKPSSSGRRGIYEAEFPPLLIKVRADGKRDAFGTAFFTRLRCPEGLRLARP